ncbi:hypothetical protein KCP77_00370 [Salmonella enterica subsp. enterica]|nr:hypothetical protein KCP77_00370 [Salmonella enterica subsp. enterica]
MANNWLVVGDTCAGFAEETPRKSLTDAGLSVEIAPFGGECSQNEIDRPQRRRQKSRGAVLVSVAVKSLYASAGAFYERPVAIAPTIASYRRNCKARSVILLYRCR